MTTLFRYKLLPLAALLVCASCATPPAKTRRPVEYHASGMASWYGRAFHGRRTASGERYNMRALTAAHRTLPFGSLVLVTNRTNGEAVKVRINDRGPFSKQRLIDVSYEAARRLGMLRVGLVPVEISLVETASSED